MPLLLRLRALPKIPVALLPVLLVGVALFIPGPLGIVVFLLGLALPLWLGYLSWPVLDPRQRTLRVLALFAVVALYLYSITR